MNVINGSHLDDSKGRTYNIMLVEIINILKSCFIGTKAMQQHFIILR